jgi:hypothetical protein
MWWSHGIDRSSGRPIAIAYPRWAVRGWIGMAYVAGTLLVIGGLVLLLSRL